MGLKFHGPGAWDRLKHGEKRRARRKSHLAVDASTGEAMAHVLTDSDTSDAAMAGPPAPAMPHGGSERERHAAGIAAIGRIAWQRNHAYGERFPAETAVFRPKRSGGERLTARPSGAQRREVALKVSAENMAIRLAKPVTVRVG